MKRRIIFMLLTSIFLINGVIVFCVAQNPKIIMNGELSSLSDELLIHNDKIYVPLVDAGSELGYSVKWDENKKEAVIIKYDAEYPANMFHYTASELDGIQLFALNRNSSNEPASDFILSVDGVNKVFNWEGQDVNRQPETSLIHNSNHIAVVTNTASGTGIHGQKLYVVDRNTMEEIPVEDVSDYLEKNINFSGNKESFVIANDKNSWTLLYKNLDKTIMNERAKVNSGFNDVETYYKYMIDLGIKYHSYYIANDEIVTCLVAIKNGEEQAIGALQFEYIFDENSYVIDEIDFIEFNSVAEQNDWINQHINP